MLKHGGIRLLFILLFVPVIAQAATYWVSTAGNDSNDCNASSTPLTTTAKRTIGAGHGCLSAGDTLRIRVGSYSESFNISGSHGSSGSRITIEAYPGEAVTWFVPSGSQQATDVFRNFTTLRGIKFDGSTGSNCLHHSEGVCGNPSPGSNPYTTIPVSGSNMLITISGTDIIVENCEFTLSAYGVLLLNTPAVRFTFRNNYVHQIGKIWNANNMYLKAPDSVFEGNTMIEMSGGALSFYTADTSSQVVNNVIARNNYIERAGYFWAPTAQNGTRTDTGAQITQGTINTSHGSGLSITRGHSQQVYNNVVVNSFFPIGTGDNVSGCIIANNTIYGNLAGGFGLDDGYAALSVGSGTSSCQIRNNIVYTPGVTSPPPMFNGGSGNTFSHNTCSSTSASLCTHIRNPVFVSEGSKDFRLQGTSPDIDAGTDLSGSILATDILGVSRPQGAAWDRGAYEFASSDPPDPSPMGLLAKWTLDNTPNDATPNNNHGTLEGGASFTSPGIIGTHALQLSGSGQYMSIPGTVNNNPTANGCISAWFNTCTSGGGSVIIGPDAWGSWVRPNGSFSCWINGSQYIEIGGSTTVINCTNHHGVCTWNGTVFQAYVDNTLVGSIQTTVVPPTSNDSYDIGRWLPNTGLYFNGKIDQAYVYGDYCTSQGVSNLFTEQVPTGEASLTNYQWVGDTVDQPLIGSQTSPYVQQLGINLGLEIIITNNTGSEITEFFPLQARRNGGTWTTLTNTPNSLGVYIANSFHVNMGDSTSQRLPNGTQTFVPGRVVVDTIDTSQKTTIPHGGATAWRYIINFASPAASCDVYQFRAVRENQSVFEHYGNDTTAFLPTVTLQDPATLISSIIQGGQHTGGTR